MEGTYSVLLGNEPVGQVLVERHGLYYHFRCQCQLHSEVICRITVSCGGKHENLGILVPSGKDYHLTKSLPIKLFSKAVPEFWITPRQAMQQNLHIDIYPEEPFRYIAKLERAYLDNSNGKPVIVINNVV